MDVTQKNTAEIQFAWVMQKRIDTTWQYLWNPMAYYEKVKEKHNAWEQLTDWEKKILENWKYLYNLADDFINWHELWFDETLRQGLIDWEIIHPANTIEWQTVNDYFNSVIEDSYILAWGWEICRCLYQKRWYKRSCSTWGCRCCR